MYKKNSIRFGSIFVEKIRKGAIMDALFLCFILKRFIKINIIIIFVQHFKRKYGSFSPS